MKRRDEIIIATLGCRKNYADLKRPITPDDVADGFEKGAYWADKTMIDKVEKYLRAKIILYTLATTVGQREEWFNDFRKAIEE